MPRGKHGSLCSNLPAGTELGRQGWLVLSPLPGSGAAVETNEVNAPASRGGCERTEEIQLPACTGDGGSANWRERGKNHFGCVVTVGWPSIMDVRSVHTPQELDLRAPWCIGVLVVFA